MLFRTIQSVALVKSADVSAPIVGDAWVLVQAFALAMRIMLNERAARWYPGYSLTLSALQLSIMGVAVFFWVSYHVSTSAGTLTFPMVADAFCTMSNGFGLLYIALVSIAMTYAFSSISFAIQLMSLPFCYLQYRSNVGVSFSLHPCLVSISDVVRF